MGRNVVPEIVCIILLMHKNGSTMFYIYQKRVPVLKRYALF